MSNSPDCNGEEILNLLPSQGNGIGIKIYRCSKDTAILHVRAEDREGNYLQFEFIDDGSKKKLEIIDLLACAIRKQYEDMALFQKDKYLKEHRYVS